MMWLAGAVVFVVGLALAVKDGDDRARRVK